MIVNRAGRLGWMAVVTILIGSGCGSPDSGDATQAESSSPAAMQAPAPAPPAPPADPEADRTGYLFPILENGRWGMMDAQGRTAVSPAFDVVDMFDGDVARARHNGLWGLINREGQWIIQPQYTQLLPFEGGVLGYMKDKTPTVQEAGYLTRDGQVIWNTDKGHAGEFSEGLAPVWATDAANEAIDVRFIRADGSEAFKVPGATFAGTFADGRALAVKGGKHGYLDNTGQWVVEPKYDWAWPFQDGMGLVAVVGEKSRPANEREQQQAASSQGVRREVWLKGAYGFVNAAGEEVIAPQFDSAWPFHDGLAWVEKGGKTGFIDKTGAIVIPMEFEKAGFFVERAAPVMTDGKWGLALKGGEVPTGLKFDALLETTGDVMMGQMVEGLLPVKEGGVWGYIDENFNAAIAPQFAEARHFSGGRAAAREMKDGAPGQWGFIDVAGNWAVAPQFDKADDFDHGLARVYQGSRMGYINPKGEFVRPMSN